VRKLYEKVARAEEADHDRSDLDDIEALAEQHMVSAPAVSRSK